MNFKSIRVLLFLVIITFCQEGFSSVWPTQNTWDQNWEDKYSQWVKHNWTQDVFTNPHSLLYGIPTDCAKATYIMRATFSYLNKLEFSAHSVNPEHTGRLISNTISLFDNENDQNRRFLKFIRYFTGFVNSRSLSVDTYPIKISRETLRPGTIYVSPGEHSFQIIDLKDTGIPVTLSSTSDIIVRVLFRSEAFPFYLPTDKRNHSDGYRAFRQPKDLAAPDFEQYELSQLSNDSYFLFTDLMVSKLSLRPETIDEKVRRSLSNLCFYARERAFTVVMSYVHWQSGGRRCMNSGDYYAHSTFDRDRQLKSDFLIVKRINDMADLSDLSPLLKQRMSSVFSQENLPISRRKNGLPNLNPSENETLNSELSPQNPRQGFTMDFYNSDAECKVETSSPYKPILKLSEVWNIVSQDKIISDPNATILQRWGLEPYSQVCPKY